MTSPSPELLLAIADPSLSSKSSESRRCQSHLHWLQLLPLPSGGTISQSILAPCTKKSKWTPRNSALVCTAEHMNRTRISSFSKSSFRLLDAVQLVYQFVSYLVPLKMVVWKVFTAKRCEEYQIFLPNAWLGSMSTSMSMCVCECQVHGRNKESLTVIPCIALVGFSLARQSWMAQHTCNAL